MATTTRPTVQLVKASSPKAPSTADVVVVGLAGSGEDLHLVGLPTGQGMPTAEDLLALARNLGAKPEAGSTTALPVGAQRGIVVGLGADECSPEQLRRSAGAALRAAAALAGEQALSVQVSLGADEPELVRAVAEGSLLGAYTPTKVSATPATPKVSAIEVVSPLSSPEAKEAVETGRIVADAVCVARDWVNLPANLLYPETFAAAAKEAMAGLKVDVELLDEKALAKGGYGGILAVGGGSDRAPRLVRLDHNPRGARNHLVLVGKGITFDTGGLNLKPSEGMYTMKCDMAGAAAVIAATRAIAQLGLGVHVTAYASMAENMPSGSAYRPSDVITMYGGITVENANSDAEGRLVMADALARSREDEADLVVDVATLTGACMVALGLRTAGLMASDDETADLVLDAAEAAGEDFWQLPIPEHIRKDLDSKVADLKSSGARYGGALTAGAFLQRFVGEDQAWAHLDIAGPAFNDAAPYDHVPTGGTGAAVRTLVALAASLQG